MNRRRSGLSRPDGRLSPVLPARARVLRRTLPFLTALALGVGSVNAHRLPARTVWGDVYAHVPNHLVTAGMALLVSLSLLVLAPGSSTVRARRTSTWASGGWGLLSAVFVLDAVGGGIGDRSGDYAVHDVAMLLLPAAGLLVLVTSLLLVVTGGGWGPWPLRTAALAAVPGTLALNEASSGPWLAAGLAAAAVWLAVAVSAARSPDRPRTQAPVVPAETPA